MAEVKTKGTRASRRLHSGSPDRPAAVEVPLGRGRPQSRYMSDEAKSPFLYSWAPTLRAASTDVAGAYTLAAARAIDTIHNYGLVSGAVDQAVSSTVGTGLRLALRPNLIELGWDETQSAEWARNVEQRWQGYSERAYDCDVAGRATVGQMSAQALRSYYAFGEITAAIPYVKRPGNQWGTKVQMIDPQRLVRWVNVADRLFYGIVQDDLGHPLAYRIQSPLNSFHPYSLRDIPARDGYGRPQFAHSFDGMVGAVRGITPMVAVLKIVRQYDQLADATLTQALIQAIFAATIKSPDLTETALNAFKEYAEVNAKPGSSVPELEAILEGRAGYYDATKVDLARHGKIAHLAPGDELVFHANQTPNAFYEFFVKILMREIARAIGVTYEELSLDFSNATYSSVRMATSVIWQIVLYRRQNILAPWLDKIFEAWLEEDIEIGGTPFPGGVEAFHGLRGSTCRTFWRGPAKPQADDYKFAKAVEVLRNLGVITDEYICAELGEDWEENYEQRAREMARRGQLGLPELPLVTATTDLQGDQLIEPTAPGGPPNG